MFSSSCTRKDFKPFGIERLAHTNSFSHPRDPNTTDSDDMAW
jgi:hypothetical protein